MQIPCGANKWNNESGSHDQQDCRLCPPFSSTLGIQSASSREHCKCDVDYFDNSFITGACEAWRIRQTQRRSPCEAWRVRQTHSASG